MFDLPCFVRSVRWRVRAVRSVWWRVHVVRSVWWGVRAARSVWRDQCGQGERGEIDVAVQR